MVVGQAMLVVGAGLATGFVASAVLSRALAGTLRGTFVLDLPSVGDGLPSGPSTADSEGVIFTLPGPRYCTHFTRN